MKTIYADYNATTPILNVVKNYLTQDRLNGPFANPNSLHHLGNKILQGIEQCRDIIANHLCVDSSKLVFTSGSSESISTAFWMSIGQNILNRSIKNHIVCSEIEHAAVIEAAKYWEQQGAIVHWVKCLKTGVIDLEHLYQLMDQFRNNIAIVAIMAANNETGVLQPFEKIAEYCKEKDILYLCDTTQIIGKMPIPQTLQEGVFLCGSAHKLGAPFGSGFLLLPHKDKYSPLVFGGGQEKNLRSGTQNYLGIECMTVALDWHYQNINQWMKISESRNQFEVELKKFIREANIISQHVPRLPNTSLISFKGIHSQGLQIELEARNIFVTTSAACSDNEPSTSKVLRAMGMGDDEGRSVLRISTGLEFDLNNYGLITQSLKEAYHHLEKISYTGSN
jgi:cysteine desulfurase